MNSTLRLFTIMIVFTAVACDNQKVEIPAVVESVRITASHEFQVEENAAGDAAVGAVVGGFIGFPTAGAIIGAASSDPKDVVLVTELLGCRVIVKTESVLVAFESTYSSIAARCSLLRTGDKIFIRQGRLGDGLTYYLFTDFPDGVVLPN